MEDDNGLELSLGLSFGRSSGKLKIKDTSSDPKADEGSNNKLTSDSNSVADPSFKNFFQKGTENQDQKGKQKSAPDLQQSENFFTDLGKSSTPVMDHPNDELNRYQELWDSNNKTTDIEEEKPSKRKMPFEEINFQNKHEKVAEFADRHGKNLTGVNLMRNPYVPVTTEDACSGVNEEVAESEAEGSNSWLVSQQEEKSKSSDIPKFCDKYVVTDSSGKKELSISGNESSQDLGKVAYGIPVLQPLTVTSVAYPVPVTNTERPVVQAANTNNLQLSFGYSSVQLPTLETGSSWAFNSQPRQVTSLLSREGAPNTQNSDGLKTSHVQLQAPRSLSGGTIHEDKSLEFAKINVNNVPQNDDQSKGVLAFLRQKEKTSQSITVGGPDEGCTTIRPGIASDVKFGGSGSYPDLPWVSTTGSGPNGKTISGVTYKYNQNEIRIVCACHGTHMSPEKFVQHASGDSSSNAENNTAVASAKS
ncbi:uncharacterized protein A4U43_C05F19480 [Asparagus officinalis]|uniref:Ninja-family protein n=1 Tax=Asparagus officinalis TaxID=4686 RepID=A0A5P1ESY8_ASPOF|nr:ninja-family protein Os05g0558800-like [Asparagus officinalis]ONK69112.1 uncharacterized protein A4U43_C05F19480 [Asparagus officinalis]